MFCKLNFVGYSRRMGESQRAALSDEFYRTRLTSLIVSIALFGVSISRSNVDRIKILDVDFTGFNHKFFVLALWAAATLSIVSLWVKYLNERHYVARIAAAGLFDLEITRSKMELIDSAADALQKMFTEWNQRIEALAVETVTEKGKFVADYVFANDVFLRFNGVIQDLRTDLQLILEENTQLIGHRLESAIGRLEDQQAQVNAKLPEDAGPISWTLTSIQQVMNQQVLAYINQIESAALILSQFNRALARSKLELRAEVIWLGVVFPSVLYAIAFLHAFGATIWGPLWSLPDGVERLLG